MGLFGRLRASSSAQARPTTNEAAPPLPLPPPPHTASLYASSSRLSIHPSETAQAQAHAQAHPQTPKSGKSFWKRKPKGSEKEVLGFSYESTTPTGSGSFSIDRPRRDHEPTGSGDMRSDPQRDHSARGEVYRMVDRQDTSTETPRQSQYPQQRSHYPQPHQPAPKGILKPKAMLGKLDFEQDSSTDEEKVTSEQQRYPSYAAYDALRQPVATGYAQRPQTMVMGQHPGMNGAKREVNGYEHNVSQPRMSMEEQMEHLVSPEKQKNWTPQSRRMSVSSDADEPSSPTPRKSNLPPQDLGTPTASAPASRPSMSKAASSDGHHSQPHSTRRPSSSRRSSFIPLGNPFARSSTRLSLSNDFDGQSQAVDDGSFQLRSFRHVSGASEADFAWNPPAVFPNVDQPLPGIKTSTSNNTAPVVASPVSVNAPIPSRPSSTQPIPSRPVSRATSLQSLDDHISTSAKVSAAAFRKKIRRPSESASTHLDMDDDDDDVPLGMLRPGMRTTSAISLSSMKDGARTPGSGPAAKAVASGSPARNSTTMSSASPATPTKVGAVSLSPSNAPEGRKVPGRSRTTPLISPDEIHPMFPSPAGSPSGSPALGPVEVAVKPEEVGYFGLNGNAKTNSPAPASTLETGGAADDSPLFDFKSLDYPIEAITESPPASRTVLHGAKPALEPSFSISPSNERTTKLSIAVPGSRDGKADGGGSTARQEGLDTDLVVRSMAFYADGNNTDENEPPTPRVALHQQSHSTLFGDASSDNSTIRSPLSERLGNLVGPRPMSSKPSLPKLDTLKLEDGNERIKSPGSDTTISPTVSTIRDHQSVPSSFARTNGAHKKPQSLRKAESNDSDTESGSASSEHEDDDEDDGVVPPKRPEGPPRSSFTNAPRPRVPPPTYSPSRAKQTRESSPSGDESDDQDQPLAKIKSKVSRSKLASGNQVSNVPVSGRPRSVFDQQKWNDSSSKAATTPLPSATPQFASQTRRASVPAVVSVPMHGTTKGNGTGGAPGSPTKRIWSASPASSQSGLTGDSSAIQPVTPSENEMADGRPFKAPPAPTPQQWGESKRNSVSWAPEHRSRRNSTYSVATAPPEHGPRGDENAPPVPSIPNGIDPMDPMMRQRMKEVWQAQYMAAASRAFEDEWERQSTASASVAAPSIAPTPQSYSVYPMPQSPPPHPLSQSQAHPHAQVHSPYGMPMGYGFPQQMPPMPHMPHMPQGYVYPGWNPGMSPHPYGPGLGSQPEPSMYSYGAGAQSVYGAEFGPSQAHMLNNSQSMSPYNRPMSMGFPQSYSTTNLHQPYDYNQHQQRPSLPSSKSTSYFQHSQPQSQSQSHSQQHQHQQHQHQQHPSHHRQSSRESSRRDRESDLDYTPPPRGLIHSVPNSPRGANRRSQLGTSVISANDRSATTAGPPPTSWRRSSGMPLLAFDEEEATPRKKRASVIIN